MIFRTSLIQFNYIPLIQSPRISFSHDGFLVHIRFTLFQFLFQPVQREVKVVVAVEVEVIAHTAAIGRDSLVVRNAVEAEQLLHTGEIGVGKADGFFVGKPFLHIVMIGLAALGSTFAGNKDEFDVIALGDLCPQVLTVLDG